MFGSGPILNEALRAQAILAEKYGVQADVWSVTSYNELRREALATERWNRLHPAEKQRQPYMLTALEKAEGPIIAASDYMKVVPDQLAPWLGTRLVTLGTDGFGRSDNREHLRRHFEINAESIAGAALSRLAREGKFDAKKPRKPLPTGREHGEDRPGTGVRSPFWGALGSMGRQAEYHTGQRRAVGFIRALYALDGAGGQIPSCNCFIPQHRSQVVEHRLRVLIERVTGHTGFQGRHIDRVDILDDHVLLCRITGAHGGGTQESSGPQRQIVLGDVERLTTERPGVHDQFLEDPRVHVRGNQNELPKRGSARSSRASAISKARLPMLWATMWRRQPSGTAPLRSRMKSVRW